jgi:hypothetical protein
MLGGFGASGGITTGKLSGGVVVGGSTRAKNFGFGFEESVPDVGLMTEEVDADDGANEPALMNLWFIPLDVVVVDDLEQHGQELPAALGHRDLGGLLPQVHLSDVHLAPLLF